MIANQKQAEIRLNNKMSELEKLNRNVRQALIMASEAAATEDDARPRSTRKPPRRSPTS